VPGPTFRDYLRVEQVGGVLLLAAAVLALVVANVPGLDGAYDDLRSWTFGPSSVGARLSLEHWAADGLLAVFFFVAGLEVKRELVVGELSDRKAAALPVLAALGGMVVPALLYVAVTGAGDRGWATPMATDIAFALGVLAVVGAHAPAGLRIFLLSLAVVDDLGAIAVIAVFFSSGIEVLQLTGALVLCVAYAVLQRRRVTSPWLYVPLAVALWLLVHASGVHATVAGIALGLLTRVRPDEGEEHAPADRLEHRLQPWSAGLVVPVFAFTAAGVALSGSVVSDSLTDRAAIGIVVGLVVGKTIGVLGGAWLAVRCGLARLPSGLAWSDVAGVAVLAGTGFTVSLLIAGLAYDDPAQVDRVVLAVLVASVIASLLGALAIRLRRGAHVGEERAT
jgi:NhaA family Na+:H+ antiporter